MLAEYWFEKTQDRREYSRVERQLRRTTQREDGAYVVECHIGPNATGREQAFMMLNLIAGAFKRLTQGKVQSGLLRKLSKIRIVRIDSQSGDMLPGEWSLVPTIIQAAEAGNPAAQALEFWGERIEPLFDLPGIDLDDVGTTEDSEGEEWDGEGEDSEDYD
jgi:hypothetical protein